MAEPAKSSPAGDRFGKCRVIVPFAIDLCGYFPTGPSPNHKFLKKWSAPSSPAKEAATGDIWVASGYRRRVSPNFLCKGSPACPATLSASAGAATLAAVLPGVHSHYSWGICGRLRRLLLGRGQGGPRRHGASNVINFHPPGTLCTWSRFASLGCGADFPKPC